MSRPSVPESYFAEMYRAAPDPWHLAERWYEQRKYALTMASLPLRSYRSAFEPGCSVGVLSELLAQRCDRLLSWDRRPEAVDAARARVAAFEGARVECGRVPDEWPEGRYDLIVLSEVAYYLDARERARLCSAALRSLAGGGHLVAAHWRHHVPEHAAEAVDVHRELRAVPGLHLLAAHEEDDFLLDVFGREGRSVAALEGLI